MKKNSIPYLVHIGIFFSLVFILSPRPILASSTDGTIDSVYKYAWSENLGWINMGTPEGNVHVTDTKLTGYSWNQNTGWISFQVSTSTYVANDAEGNLSGYAWGEGIGYIDFSGVTIDSEGFFHGYASSTLGGRISFNCLNTNSCNSGDFKTKTDWQKASVRVASATAYNPSQTSVPSAGSVSAVSYKYPTHPPASDSNPNLSTSSNIKNGYTGPEVKDLQIFLNNNGYPIVMKGSGSLGKEIDYFGKRTQNALIKFQQAHSDQGLVSELGYVGPKTAGYIANLKLSKNPIVTSAPTPACQVYMTKYIKLGKTNDTSEVMKLQKFLANYEGFPSLKQTGIYDQDTYDATIQFQRKYTDDILGPWNHSTPTGYVYKTTLKKINELYCLYKSKN